MIYFLHGNIAKDKARELVASLQKKKPDASAVTLALENWNTTRFEEATHGQGLFEPKSIALFTDLLQQEPSRQAVLERLAQLQESENIFVFVEAKVDKKTLTRIEKYAEKVQESDTDVPVVKKDFNIFSLTDAFGRRDRRSLWVLYQKALSHNAAAEEVHGILFWQLKSMLVAAESSSAKESGLAPFVFMKARGFLRNFTTDELKDLSRKLVRLYSNARHGLVEFEIGLEQFILNL